LLLGRCPQAQHGHWHPPQHRLSGHQVELTNDPDKNVKAIIAHLATEDRWYIFRAKADAFIKAYQALTPDPRVLTYQSDLKLVGACIPYGKLEFENTEETDWKKYSQKIREMLDEHLEVTGLKSVCKLRSLTDPAFWDDFDNPKDIRAAAVRKLAELKKETAERAAKNPARYEKFSDRVKELIEKFNEGLLDVQQVFDFAKQVAEDVAAEDKAHQDSGLNERAFSIHTILAKFKAKDPTEASADSKSEATEDETKSKLTQMQEVAKAIDNLYASEETAPPHWQDKTQLKKELRRVVRKLVRPLDLDGWKTEIPLAVQHYAVQHYAKP